MVHNYHKNPQEAKKVSELFFILLAFLILSDFWPEYDPKLYELSSLSWSGSKKHKYSIICSNDRFSHGNLFLQILNL